MAKWFTPTVPVLGMLMVQCYAFPEAKASVYEAKLVVRSLKHTRSLSQCTQGSCSAQLNPVLGSETPR